MRFRLKTAWSVALAFAGLLLLPVLPARSGPILEYYTEGFFTYAPTATSSTTSLMGKTSTNLTYTIAEGLGYNSSPNTGPLQGTNSLSDDSSSSMITLTDPKNNETAKLTFAYSGLQGPQPFPSNGISTLQDMGLFSVTSTDTNLISFGGSFFGFVLDIFQIDPSTGSTLLAGSLDGNITDNSSPGKVNVHFTNPATAILGTSPAVTYQLNASPGTSNTAVTTTIPYASGNVGGSAEVTATISTPVGLPPTAGTSLLLLAVVGGFEIVRRRIGVHRIAA